MARQRTALLVGIGVLTTAVAVGAAAFAGREGARAGPCCAAGPANVPQPSAAELDAADLDDLPLAPRSARVDLVAEAFSKPTEIDNPLFPIGGLHATVLNGVVDGKSFKVETTLLPSTRMIEWGDAWCVEALASQ